jgi:hypothetical protein
MRIPIDQPETPRPVKVVVERPRLSEMEKMRAGIMEKDYRRAAEAVREREELFERVDSDSPPSYAELLWAKKTADLMDLGGRLELRESEERAMAEVRFNMAVREIHRLRESGADDEEVFNAALSRFYRPGRYRYQIEHNDLASSFKEKATGNCEGRTNGISALLESSGTPPERIFLETWSDHIRTVVEGENGTRYLLEGATLKTWEATPGTTLTRLDDVKRALAGVPQEQGSFMIGDASFRYARRLAAGGPGHLGKGHWQTPGGGHTHQRRHPCIWRSAGTGHGSLAPGGTARSAVLSSGKNRTPSHAPAAGTHRVAKKNCACRFACRTRLRPWPRSRSSPGLA